MSDRALTASWEGSPWFLKNWKHLPQWLQAVAGRTVESTGRTLYSEARRNLTPAGGLGLKVRTGRLLKSLEVQVNKDGGVSKSLVVRYAAVPGRILNDGGIIRPKSGRKYMTFPIFDEGDPNPHFVTVASVMIRPTGWLDKAVKKASQRVMPAFAEAVRLELMK